MIKAGANVVCGGTNAAGIGFAGGPFILEKDGRIVDIRSGEPVADKTLVELRGRVNAAHARGVKVLGEVIRFYMTPWIQAEHPDWQEIVSPGGKPISVEELKQNPVLGCWNSPYGDWFIRSQVETGPAARLGRLQHGRLRLLDALLLPRPGPAAGGTGWGRPPPREPTPCIARSTRPSSSSSGASRPIRARTCSPRSPAATTAR